MNKMILINGKGEEYDLLDGSKSPGWQLEGLGYEDDTEFLRIGSDYFPLEEASAQNVLETTLLFMDSSDAKYSEFVRFARHDPLVLHYGNFNGTYYIPCRLKSVSKIDQYRIRRFSSPVKLTQTGHPYKKVSAFNEASESDGKAYDYSYDYVYSNDIANTVFIASDSYVDSPCILTIYGPAINPIWRHYNNGELVETGEYAGTIPSGHYLVIDSKSMPYSIIEYDSAGVVVADRYQLCNFSTERFLHVNEGDNRYVVSHDGTTDLKVKAEAYIEYETI